jgi:hypothetical protein
MLRDVANCAMMHLAKNNAETCANTLAVYNEIGGNPAQPVRDSAESLKGCQDGRRADFSKNLRASLFNNEILKEPNFGRIVFTGQYL